MRIFALRGAAIVLALIVGASADAQTWPYDGTYFVHGFNDNPTRFDATPAALIERRVDLRSVRTPWLSAQASVATQASQLRSFLSAYRFAEDSLVIVGHSMGGVVARNEYLRNSAGMGALVTLGSPHRGAPAAAEGARFEQYVRLTTRRAVAAISPLLVIGPVLDKFLQDFFESLVGRLFVDGLAFTSPAAVDLRPTSTTMQVQYAARGDAALRRANVLGSIPPRNAVFYVFASAVRKDNKASEWIGWKSVLKSYAKTCKHVSYATIVLFERGRRCARLDRSLGALDNVWLGATNGYVGRRPRQVPSDGFIPHDHSEYPSSGPIYREVVTGVNHNNLPYNPASVNAIARALFAVGAQQLPLSP